MKVLQVGIFNDHELGGCIVFEKGLQQNGCSIERFDYRYLSDVFGTDAMNRLLIEKSADKDIVFIGKGELVKKETLQEIRKKGIKIILWYGDIRPSPEAWLINLLSEVDAFFMSSGGEILKQYFREGKPKIAAYYFNPSDPELTEKFNYLPRGFRNIVFTGSANSFCQKERLKVIKHLHKRTDVSFWGGAENLILSRIFYRMMDKIFKKNNTIRGVSYIQAIKSAKIGIGVNAIQNVDKYTSDRLTHYLEFGTFFLALYFPKAELLFNPGKEIAFFTNAIELENKIKYYLDHDDEREIIAQAGSRRINEEYNTKNIVEMMLEIVQTGSSHKFPWIEIYK